MKYLFEKEINISGVQRTGQHAIISWVAGNFNNVIFKNSVSPEIYGRKRNLRTMNDVPTFLFNFCENRYEISDVEKTKYDFENKVDAIIIGTEYKSNNIELNRSIDEEKQEISKKLGFNGFSKERKNILTIRSPYNHLASLLKWNERYYRHRKQYHPTCLNFKKIWITIADEYLGNNNKIPSPKMVVKYDDWFSDINYRKEICNFIETPFSDKGLNIVMRIGRGGQWGSSFDGMKLKESAQKMDVMERWKKYINHDLFREIILDQELKSKSELIFGKYPEDLK